MIKHSLKEGILSLSIEKVDFSFRIPLNKIENTIDWRVGAKGPNSLVIKGVSSWALQLFTKNITEDKYIKQFRALVQTHSPENKINWEETRLAITIQNEYNRLILANATAEKKHTETEILSNLKRKYKI